MSTQHIVTCHFAVLALAASFSASCHGQSSRISSSDAKGVISKRDSDIRELEKTYKLKLQELSKAFSTKADKTNQLAAEKLEKIQSEVASEDLDDAVKIRDKAMEFRNSTAKPSNEKRKDESIETLKNRIRELTKNNASLKKDIDKARRLALAFPSVEKLIKFVQGTDYRQSNGPVWSFHADGTLLFIGKSGKKSGRWAAIDADTIVTQMDEGKHIDRFEFTTDGTGYTVKHIGTADKILRELTGQLILSLIHI